VQPETTGILEENTNSNFSDICLSNIFLDMSSETRATKANNNNKKQTKKNPKTYWDYIKIKSFSTVKETINKTKKQHVEWEIF